MENTPLERLAIGFLESGNRRLGIREGDVGEPLTFPGSRDGNMYLENHQHGVFWIF